LEATFRYPGPKPQTREAAVVMLADAVESASRALAQPTPGSIRKLVRDLMMKRLLDGQFEESGLTLTEVYQVEEALCKGLVAMYHNRIKYPEPERKAG
jgi:membrane-associated HD superfamily phosphohydrolase